MNAKEFLKKYGVWIGGGVLLVYLVLKNATGGRSGAIAGANQNALELARLQSQERLAAGQFGLESARLANALELERIRAKAQQDALNQAIAQRNRELGAQSANAKLKAILDAISNAARRAIGTTGGGEGRDLPRTPPIAGNRGPIYIPPPNLDLGSILNPPYEPAYPEPNLPGFDLPGIAFDSGLTFADQGITDMFALDWGQYDFGSFGDNYSSYPELTSGGDTGSYLPSAGEDFYYGYGAGEVYDSGETESYEDYGYGTDE